MLQAASINANRREKQSYAPEDTWCGEDSTPATRWHYRRSGINFDARKFAVAGIRGEAMLLADLMCSEWHSLVRWQ